MNEQTVRKIATWGIVLMTGSFVFAIAETIYFGSNMHPESAAEVFCDSLAIVGCEAGCVLFTMAVFLKIKTDIQDLLRKL